MREVQLQAHLLQQQWRQADLARVARLVLAERVLAEVVDVVHGGQHVHRGEVFGAAGVVVVAVDGEHGQPHVEVGVLRLVHAGLQQSGRAEHLRGADCFNVCACTVHSYTARL